MSFKFCLSIYKLKKAFQLSLTNSKKNAQQHVKLQGSSFYNFISIYIYDEVTFSFNTDQYNCTSYCDPHDEHNAREWEMEWEENEKNLFPIYADVFLFTIFVKHY